MQNNIVHDVCIRELVESDIEFLRLLRNKEENRKNFIYQKEISYEEQLRYYDRYKNTSNDYMYTIISKKDEIPLGFAAIYDVTNNIGEFGRLIVDKTRYTSPGLGKYILNHLIDIAREKLGLQKLRLEVFEDNVPAMKIYKFCGFQGYSESIVNGRKLIYMELNF